jgi:hypothetical protein
MNAGAAIGTIAHEAIHAWAAGDVFDTFLPDDPAGLAATQAALAWMQEQGVEVDGSEVIVCDAGVDTGWAGTLDLIARIDGKLTVVDFKTNRSGLYTEHLLQVAAYASAVERLSDATIQQTMLVHCDREGRGYTTVTRDDYEWRTDEVLFRAALDLYKGMRVAAKAVQPVREALA